MNTVYFRIWGLILGIAGSLFFGPRIEAAEGVAERARLVCENRSFEFGSIASTQQVKLVFALCSSGTIPLIIGHIQACCGLTASLASTNIPPGKSASLELKFTPGSLSGPVRKTIYLHTNDPESKIVPFRLSGTVVRPPCSTAPLSKPAKAPCGCP